MPANASRLSDIMREQDLTEIEARACVAQAGLTITDKGKVHATDNGEGWDRIADMVHELKHGAGCYDIANPMAATYDDPPSALWCIRLDDRGDHCIYVWGALGIDNEQDAIEEAEEFVRTDGYNEDYETAVVSFDPESSVWDAMLVKSRIIVAEDMADATRDSDDDND
jgi:hypothetical protein